MNTIDARSGFSCQKPTYPFHDTLDLDQMLHKYGTIPQLHRMLAIEHGIDTHSYLFEVTPEKRRPSTNWPLPCKPSLCRKSPSKIWDSIPH